MLQLIWKCKCGDLLWSPRERAQGPPLSPPCKKLEHVNDLPSSQRGRKHANGCAQPPQAPRLPRRRRSAQGPLPKQQLGFAVLLSPPMEMRHFVSLTQLACSPWRAKDDQVRSSCFAGAWLEAAVLPMERNCSVQVGKARPLGLHAAHQPLMKGPGLPRSTGREVKLREQTALPSNLAHKAASWMCSKMGKLERGSKRKQGQGVATEEEEEEGVAPLCALDVAPSPSVSWGHAFLLLVGLGSTMQCFTGTRHSWG